MKNRTLRIASLLLAALAAGTIFGCKATEPYEYSQKPISCDYERVGTTDLGELYIPCSRFIERCRHAVMVADVEILKLEYSFDTDDRFGYTVFSARILNCYKTKLNYTEGDTIYFIQRGTPQKTITNYPLLAESSRLLLVLDLSERHFLDEKAASDYPVLFHDEDTALLTRFQIFTFNGTDYAIAHDSHPFYGNEFEDYLVPDEESEAVLSAFIEYDPVLESVSIFGKVFRYDDLIEALKSQEIIF